MTVCIAATCEINVAPKIILCSDWQLSSSLGAAQTGWKQRMIKEGWFCMYAGDPSAAFDIINLLRGRMISSSKLDDTNIVKLIRDALNDRKRALADEFTQGRYGMSYHDFLTHGKSQLPLDIFQRAILAIENLRIGADCIIAGFSDGFPILVETDQQCRAHIRESFTAIGEGAYLAHASLMHRQHDELGLLGTSLYSVFEAKKWAERVRSVGDFTSISVLSSDGKFQRVSGSGKSFLEQQFNVFGPKTVPHDLSLPESSIISDSGG